MYVVRDIFTAKPGCASKLASLMKRAFVSNDSARVMTDLIADFNTVVLEFSVNSIAEYEETMRKYKAGEMDIDPAVKEEMKGYTELWLTGRREIYQVTQ